MKKLKGIVVIFVLFISAFALSGCGDKDTDLSLYEYEFIDLWNIRITNYLASDDVTITEIEIPSTVKLSDKTYYIKYIGESAFEGSVYLTSIEIPNSVTTIISSAFKDCTSLTSISIPDSVTYFGDSTFEGCTSLTSINIPNGVKY
ncbi:MAG: leucine-rich repeat domain-containing protein, partial [Mycoplasmatota bacterium]